MQKATNNLIKELKKQKRDSCSLLFLDNIKIIKDALKAGVKIKYLLLEPDKYDLFKDSDKNILIADKKMIAQLSDTKTPQGVVCITEYIQDTVKCPKENFLVLDGLQDPGNVGTLIRSACACGFNEVYLVDSVKINNPKLIRSSAGTIFNVKIYSCSKNEFIKLANDYNLNLANTDMRGTNIFKFHNEKPIGLVIGNEGNGVSEEISRLCVQTLSIPMLNNVESLNAGISGSIIMYQLSKNKFT